MMKLEIETLSLGCPVCASHRYRKELNKPFARQFFILAFALRFVVFWAEETDPAANV